MPDRSQKSQADLWKDQAWVYEEKLHICHDAGHVDRMKTIGAEVFDLRDAYKMNLSDSVIDQICTHVFDGQISISRRENWIDGFKISASAHAKKAVEQAIAFLRRNSDDPVSIELGHGIDIEVSPAKGDQRVCVGREGQGYTVVNYTPEGLIVDIYSADLSSLEPLSTCAYDLGDLTDPEAHEAACGLPSEST